MNILTPRNVAAVLVALNALIWLSLAWAISGCGGSGGDAEDTATPDIQQILCEHDGDLWLCNEQNSCIRDQSSIDAGSTEDSAMRYLIREVAGAPRYYAKLSSGAITIIAECGSNVSFNMSESSETDANTTNTNTNFNAGYNTAAEAP